MESRSPGQYGRAISRLYSVPLQYRDGYYDLPTGPGLGADLLVEALGDEPARQHPATLSIESRWM